MKKSVPLIVALSSILVGALFAAPAKINYQGLITDATGEPIESSTNTVTATLYGVETSGNAVYTESFSGVNSDASGVYSIQIGDINLQALLEVNNELWLELTINGETLAPRQQVHSVPYALHAESANRLVNAETSNIAGDLSVNGNTALGGNVNVSSSLNVAGPLTTDYLEVNGPFGSTRFDGEINRIGGMNTMIEGNLDVMGRITTSELKINGPFGGIRFDGFINRIGGDFLEINAMSTVIEGDLDVMRRIRIEGDLDVMGFRANFENAEEVLVPTPDRDNEATNKAYVDNLVSASIASDNAKGLVQLAVTENVSDTAAYALTYQGSTGVVTPSVGDLVLLAGQTTASENGIYTVASVDLSPSYQSSEGSTPTASDYTVSLTRATNFDSVDEFTTGSFVFVQKGSLAGQGYVLGELASDFALGTSPINYVPFTINKASDVNFEQQVSANSLTSAGDLSVNGNTALSGNVNVSNSLSVSGPSTFDRVDVMGRVEGQDARFDFMDVMGRITTSELDVMGRIRTDYLEINSPFGSTRFDGEINRIGGEILEINAMNTRIEGDLDVMRRIRIEGDLDVMGRTRINDLDVMGRTMINDLDVMGFRANFENAEEVLVPTPDRDNEATNKAYVDNLVSASIASDNAKGLVQLAVTENVSDTAAYALTYQGSTGVVTPSVGDLVLLAGQTTASENGIYTVASVDLSPSYQSSEGSTPTASDYTVSLTRATNFDSVDEFTTGSFVFVQKGSLAGQGYVLGELASDFALGTSPINYVPFTINKASDVNFEQQVSANSLTSAGDLSVNGNTALSGNVNVSNSLSVSGPSTFDRVDVMGRVEGQDARFDFMDVMGRITTSELDVMGRIRTDYLEIYSPFGDTRFDGFINRIGGDILEINAMSTMIEGDLEMFGYRANFENAEEVRVPTPDQDNEAANKAYVDSVSVPSGGLIAWPAENPTPQGWSDSGFESPIPNHIWIRKN